MGLVPSSEEDKEETYLFYFARWIEKNSNQKHMFCEHGKYWGSTGRGSFIHNCKNCEDLGK